MSDLPLASAYSDRAQRRPSEKAQPPVPTTDTYASSPTSQIVPGLQEALGARGRGNLRAHISAVQQAQQTQGNHAVQRYIQRASTHRTPRLSIQRGVTIGGLPESGLAEMERLAQGVIDAQTNFDRVAAGGFKAKEAPDKVLLPNEMVKGLQEGWNKSFPGGSSQEQGGILVKDDKGQYKWEAGAAGTSGTFMPNYGDAKAGESLVGIGHTHPYDKSEGGHTNVPFSDQDLARMVVSPEEVSVVQSGKGQFMAARTKEFDDKVKGLDEKGKQKMMEDMKKDYNEIFQKTKGKLPEKAQAAAEAVAAKYNIAYYAGEGGELSRQ